MDLKTAAATAGDHAGVICTLGASGDLNANLVRYGTGRGVGERVNDEVDVILSGGFSVRNRHGGSRRMPSVGRDAGVYTQRGSTLDRERLGGLRLPHRSPSAETTADRASGRRVARKSTSENAQPRRLGVT